MYASIGRYAAFMTALLNETELLPHQKEWNVEASEGAEEGATEA